MNDTIFSKCYQRSLQRVIVGNMRSPLKSWGVNTSFCFGRPMIHYITDMVGFQIKNPKKAPAVFGRCFADYMGPYPGHISQLHAPSPPTLPLTRPTALAKNGNQSQS